MSRMLLHVTLCLLFVMSNTSLMAKETDPLSFMQKTDEGYSWLWLFPDRLEEQVIAKFKNQPSAFYWEKNENTIRVVLDDKITAFSRSGAKITGKDLPLPALLTGERVKMIWRDRDQQDLRIASWLDVREDQIENAIIKLENGTRVRGYDEVDWGNHAIVRLFSWDGQHWQVKKTMATRTNDPDTPGFSVIKPFWTEEGISGYSQKVSRECKTLDNMFLGRKCDDDTIPEAVRNGFYDQVFASCKRLYRGYPDPDDCGAIASTYVECENCSFALAHPVRITQNTEGITPAYTYDLGADKFQKLDIKEEGVLYSDVKNHYAFIEVKNVIYLVDLKTGKILHQQTGTDAFWLPIH